MHASSARQQRPLQSLLQSLSHADSCENTHVRCQEEFFKMIQDDAPCLLRCEQDMLINCEVIMQGFG